MMKSTYQKQKPKIITYRNFKHFDNEKFREDLKFKIQNIPVDHMNCERFETAFLNVLDSHAPQKRGISGLTNLLL